MTPESTRPPEGGEIVTRQTTRFSVEGKTHGRRVQTTQADEIAVESPMQTNVVWTKRGRKIERPVAVTMRTPGRDVDLAIGFLIAEGVIEDVDDVQRVTTGDNQTTVFFREGKVVELCDLHRRGTTTSACGVCGKTTIEQIRVKSHRPIKPQSPRVTASLVSRLPDLLRPHQAVFARTGGLHACGLFDTDGQWLAAAEDVGRHNALDKLVGELARSAPHHFAHSILVLSGRISFELVQKSLVVGIPIIVAVGAPVLLGDRNRRGLWSNAHRFCTERPFQRVHRP